MKKLVFLALCVMSLVALADTTVGPQTWSLYRGTRIIERDFATLADCVRDADARNEVRTFGCQSNRVQVAVTADAPPPPPPVTVPTPTQPGNVGETATTLRWDAVTRDVLGNALVGTVVYDIDQRLCSSAGWVQVANDLGAPSWPFPTLAAGEYCYRVFAEVITGAGWGRSAASAELRRTVSAPTEPPPTTPPPSEPPPPTQPPPSTGWTYTFESAMQGVPFAVNPPAQPVITRDQAVTPATLGQHINTPGLRLVLGEGRYGNRTFSSRDQEIVFTQGAVLGNIDLAASARRLKFRGQQQRYGLFNIISTPWGGGPEDITFDSVVGAPNDQSSSPSNHIQGRRIAIINSSLTARDYAISSMPDGAGAVVEDIILANSRFTSTTSQSGARFMNVSRFVFVDNLLDKQSTGLVFRLHSDATPIPMHDVYVARNQIQGTSGSNFGSFIARGSNPNNTPATMENVIVENNDHYCQCSLRLGDQPHSGRIVGNRFYGGRIYYGNPESVVTALEGWTLQPNEYLPYRTPPAWGFRR